MAEKPGWLQMQNAHAAAPRSEVLPGKASEDRREHAERMRRGKSAARRGEGREYVGLSLMEMARDPSKSAGINHRGMNKNRIAELALQAPSRGAEYFGGGAESTSDFPGDHSPTSPTRRCVRLTSPIRAPSSPLCRHGDRRPT